MFYLFSNPKIEEEYLESVADYLFFCERVLFENKISDLPDVEGKEDEVFGPLYLF